ncbi:MAG: phosphotransacetylase family protein [Armatimonadota bacterium]
MRRPLYIASVDSFSGKSLTALAIGLAMREAGYRVGYLKPLGTLPLTVEGVTTDEDARFISDQLGSEAPLDAICPVLLGPEIAQEALREDVGLLPERIRKSYQRVSAGRDIVLVGGLGDLSRGSLLGLSAPQVAELLDAKVILLAKLSAEPMVEQVLLAKQLLGERVAGVIFNFVGPDQQEALRGALGQHLERRGIPVLGALGRDDLLGAITVRELAEHLPAKLLCCEKALDNLIVHFVIGAMGVASAAKYFRQLSDKAVITGGDRADIQLAALQTATKAIVLTGNIYPSGPIVARAQQLSVPLLLAPHDTLTTVERIESITGRLRVRGSNKVARARTLFEKNVDMARIMQLAGLAARV